MVSVEGIPAGMHLTEEYIAKDLLRRMQGHGRGKRMKIEKDYAEIFSGVRHEITLGSPISLLIKKFRLGELGRSNGNWKNLKKSIKK